MKRAAFVATTGAATGALVLGFDFPIVNRLAADAAEPGRLSALVRIAPDESVTIVAMQTEMGQGVATSIPMLVADAAGKFGVPASELRTQSGIVYHDASSRKATYGELASAAAALPPPADVTLKTADKFTIIGRPIKRLDIRDKVTGRAQFGIDVVVPGMLHAAIRQAPVFGATVSSYDENAISRRPGVKHVVNLKNAIAVVADRYWHAKSALDAMNITWNEGAGT